MSKRILFFGLLALLLLSATVVLAGDPGVITVPTKDYGMISFINDGRLNGADVGAPVAVYYKYDTVRQATNDVLEPFKDVKVLRGLELLSIDPKTNTGSLVLQISAKDLIKEIDKGGHKEGMVLAQNNGYSLYYSHSNWFWVTAPPDKEGKVYTFKWQNFTIQHD